MSAPAWYVLRSKPHKENQVYSQLQQKRIESYFPTICVEPVNPRSSRIRPYFPGYMFVRVTLDDVGIHTFEWLPGAVGLVQFDGYAASVPENFISALKRRVAAIEAAGGLIFDGLKRGDPVSIIDGPLAGYAAVFDARLKGGERVRVLLELLGRFVKTEISAGAIQKKRTGQS